MSPKSLFKLLFASAKVAVNVAMLGFLVAGLWEQAAVAASIDVRTLGAVGDGVALETAAIQKAIDLCSQRGGGKVVFPAGRYVTGTIFLKDNVTLKLEVGATLLGSTNIADYQAVEPFVEGTGQQMGWCLIGALEAKNIGIEGPGTIDGQGKELNAARPRSERNKRPVLLRFVRCNGLSLSRVRLQASAMWMVHLAQSRNIKADRVSIYNHVAGNNDGFDIDSCDGVRITYCDIDTGDDALCLKSTRPTPSRNIFVRDCQLRSGCSSIKFGTESLGGFENVTITKCRVSKAGLGGIGIYSVDGGNVRNINISDITMEQVSVAVFLRLGSRLRIFNESDQKKPVGTFRDITIKNVRAGKATIAGVLLAGIPDHAIENVTLENIQVGVPGGGTAEDAQIVMPEKEGAYPECGMFGKTLPAYGVLLRHVKGLKMVNCQVEPAKPDARPMRFEEDVQGLEWKS